MTDAEINRALRRGYTADYLANPKHRAKHNLRMKLYMRNYRARNAAYRRANQLRRVERYHQNSEYRKAA